MTPPTVLVNTFVRVDGKPYIDRVSKMFIICGLPFGIIRLPLFGKVNPIFTLLLSIYSIGLITYLITFFNSIDYIYLLDFAIGSCLFQYIFFIIFNLVFIRRLQRYYLELNVFDKEVACTPKVGKGTIRNIAQIVFMVLYIAVMFSLPYVIEIVGNMHVAFIPVLGSHVLEVHYNGHLLSLLIPRLRLINYYMELSLSNTKITKTTNVEEFGFSNGSGNKSLCEMEKLMNLYHTVIKAYNYLIEAIKWQLLVTIITSFIGILSYCYHVSYAFIKDETTISLTALSLGMSVGIMLPLFAPCTLGDQVHNEVRRLRELLASRLYENQLGDKRADMSPDGKRLPLPMDPTRGLTNKSSRGMARALLAWTETRDLSFSLLRMLNIDISFPFKFVGLLVTYLIILLQFQKVINP